MKKPIGKYTVPAREQLDTTIWDIVYDSYGRPIISSPEKNVLLCEVTFNGDTALVNDYLLIKKDKYIGSNGRNIDNIVRDIQAWLKT